MTVAQHRPRRSPWFCCALLALLPSLALAGSATAQRPPSRPWTAVESVRMRYVAISQALPRFPGIGIRDPIVYSPDRSRFFFVTRRGDEACDCNIYEIHVFSVQSVAAALAAGGPAPAGIRTRLTSRTNTPAVAEARWRDAGTIQFLGVHEGEARPHLLDAATGQLRRLASAVRGDVVAFDHEGGVTAAVAVTRAPAGNLLGTYPYSVLRGAELQRLLSPHDLYTRTLAIEQDNGRRCETRPFGGGALTNPTLSPDGTASVVVMPESEPPSGWQAYGPSTAATGRTFHRFALVHSANCSVGRLAGLEAPTGVATGIGMALAYSLAPPGALWMDRGRTLLLVNTAVPPQAVADWQHMPYMVAYDVAGRRYQLLEPMVWGAGDRAERRVASVRRLPGEAGILVQYANAGDQLSAGQIYRLEGGSWRGHAIDLNEAARLQSGAAAGGEEIAAQWVYARTLDAPTAEVSIRLHQGPNTPPNIVAAIGDRQLELLPQDPALDRVSWHPVRDLGWRGPDGAEVRAGLIVPETTARSERPLVVMVGAFLNDRFLPDGPGTTAYAAQLLASRGMAVLVLPYRDIPGRTSPDEMRGFVERLDRAVDEVKQHVAVADDRIGLLGFSRAGWLTYYTITHPGRTRVAASIVADSWTGSYGEYLLRAATQPGRDSAALDTFERQFGGSFWTARETWLAEANSFNVDRVAGPALFTLHGRYNQPWSFETVGAFRLARKPMEMIFFPDADHQLVRPRERIASLNLTADWMAFWLLGHQPSAGFDPDRFQRWQQLRADGPLR